MCVGGSCSDPRRSRITGRCSGRRYAPPLNAQIVRRTRRDLAAVDDGDRSPATLGRSVDRRIVMGIHSMPLEATMRVIVAGAVLAILGCGGSNDPSSPTGAAGSGTQTCRAATQACAATADCCSTLICSSSVCVAPPQCRPTGGACAATADCCSPNVCLQNSCRPAPVCGDGTCDAGESATCCKDCGCSMGSTCQTSGTCFSVGTSSLHWSFQDNCLTAGTIQLRFFDRVNHLVWPADNAQVFVINPGDTKVVDLSCTNGSTVCYGGNLAAGGTGFWGAGIDGTQACDSCCTTCNGASTPLINLLCQ